MKTTTKIFFVFLFVWTGVTVDYVAPQAGVSTGYVYAACPTQQSSGVVGSDVGTGGGGWSGGSWLTVDQQTYTYDDGSTLTVTTVTDNNGITTETITSTPSTDGDTPSGGDTSDSSSSDSSSSDSSDSSSSSSGD